MEFKPIKFNSLIPFCTKIGVKSLAILKNAPYPLTSLPTRIVAVPSVVNTTPAPIVPIIAVNIPFCNKGFLFIAVSS